jgi:hypothetical protein
MRQASLSTEFNPCKVILKKARIMLSYRQLSLLRLAVYADSSG